SSPRARPRRPRTPTSPPARTTTSPSSSSGPAERQTATAPARRAGNRPDPEEELLVLPEQNRGGRLEGREPAPALRLREGEDPLAPEQRCQQAPPAAGRGCGEAGARDGALALLGRGPRGASRRPA